MRTARRRTATSRRARKRWRRSPRAGGGNKISPTAVHAHRCLLKFKKARRPQRASRAATRRSRRRAGRAARRQPPARMNEGRPQRMQTSRPARLASLQVEARTPRARHRSPSFLAPAVTVIEKRATRSLGAAVHRNYRSASPSEKRAAKLSIAAAEVALILSAPRGRGG